MSLRQKNEVFFGFVIEIKIIFLPLPGANSTNMYLIDISKDLKCKNATILILIYLILIFNGSHRISS